MPRSVILLPERTVKRRKVGQILTRIEDRDITILAAKTTRLDEEQVKELLGSEADNILLEPLIWQLSQGPVLVIALQGESIDQEDLDDMLEVIVEAHELSDTIRYELNTSKTDLVLMYPCDSSLEASKLLALLFTHGELAQEQADDQPIHLDELANQPCDDLIFRRDDATDEEG